MFACLKLSLEFLQGSLGAGRSRRGSMSFGGEVSQSSNKVANPHSLAWINLTEIQVFWQRNVMIGHLQKKTLTHVLSTFYRRSCFHQGTSHPKMTQVGVGGGLDLQSSPPGLHQVLPAPQPGDCLCTPPFSVQGSLPQQCLGTTLFKKSAVVPQQTCCGRGKGFLLGLLGLHCHKTFPYKSELPKSK